MELAPPTGYEDERESGSRFLFWITTRRKRKKTAESISAEVTDAAGCCSVVHWLRFYGRSRRSSAWETFVTRRSFPVASGLAEDRGNGRSGGVAPERPPAPSIEWRGKPMAVTGRRRCRFSQAAVSAICRATKEADGGNRPLLRPWVSDGCRQRHLSSAGPTRRGPSRSQRGWIHFKSIGFKSDPLARHFHCDFDSNFYGFHADWISAGRNERSVAKWTGQGPRGSTAIAQPISCDIIIIIKHDSIINPLPMIHTCGWITQL